MACIVGSVSAEALARAMVLRVVVAAMTELENVLTARLHIETA